MFIVDVGFSNVKWMLGENKGRFKSLYKKTKKHEGFLFNDERYILGEKTLFQKDPGYLRTVEELVYFYPLFTAYAAQKTGIDGDESLIVGLPFEFWKSEMAKLNKGEENVIKILQTTLSSIKLDNKEHKFKNVIVYPQGLGCIKSYQNDNPEVLGNILGIDIGFNTIVYSLFSVEENDAIYSKTLYKKGIHDMAVNLVPHALDKYTSGKYYSPAEICYIIENKQIQSGFDLIDLTPDIEKAAKEYIEGIFSYIIGDLQENIGVITFNNLILGGGGARFIKQDMLFYNVHTELLDEPEFATARGFKVMAEELEKDSSEEIILKVNEESTELSESKEIETRETEDNQKTQDNKPQDNGSETKEAKVPEDTATKPVQQGRGKKKQSGA